MGNGHMPTDVNKRLGFFDRFAAYIEDDCLSAEIEELKSAVGLEDRESTTKAS